MRACLLVSLLSWIAVSTSVAEVVDVELSLPMPARLDLRDHDSVVVVPFLTVSFDGESSADYRGVDVQKEFDSYLRRLLRRSTKLKILESGPLSFPTTDLSRLARDKDFWNFVGDTTQGDLILAGAIDFDIKERRGYTTEPYYTASGTFYRQVLVQRTGYEFDILMMVFDGETGALLFADNFKDFREFERAKKDPLVGMYENLDALEGRIRGIFTERWLKTSRSMFSH